MYILKFLDVTSAILSDAKVKMEGGKKGGKINRIRFGSHYDLLCYELF